MNANEIKKVAETNTAVVERNITDGVLRKIEEFQKSNHLHLPENYSHQNALKSAWLILQETKDKTGKGVLQSCSRESIANSLLNMVVQGLSPVKKQCYFIAYGNQLQLSRSYFGTVAALKRLKGVKDVFAQVIYKDDEFDYEIDMETGHKKITIHKQSFDNIDITKIRGAYAVITMDDGFKYVEVMNISQIKASWNQGAAKGNSGAHINFADQMAMKTVISRACKMYLNTSDDSDVIVEAISSTDEDEIDQNKVVNQEIQDNANIQTLDFEEVETVVVDTPEFAQEQEQIITDPETGEIISGNIPADDMPSFMK